MNKRRLAKSVQCFSLGLFAIVACTPPSGSGGGDGGNSGNALLFVKVATQYDGSNTKVVTRQTCSVPAGSPAGTSIPCTATIPQEQLFNSSLILSQSTDSSTTCDQLEFLPYAYHASRSPNFLPEWSASSLDCTASPTPAGCFNGPAIDLISDYPAHRGLFTPTSSATNVSYTVKSANTMGRHSNRWAANDMTLPTRNKDLAGGLASVPIADAYLANSFRDYQFNCKDSYGAILYSIVLTVTSQVGASATSADVDNAAVNKHASWLGALAPQPISGTQGTFPFQVVVQTQYDNDSPGNVLLTHQTCSVPSGTAGGAAGSRITCAAAIPEAELFFGKLILTETTDATANCEILTFQPYYYVASRSATFKPEWTQFQTTDCSVTPIPANCINGPMPTVLGAQYPEFTGLYTTTNVAISQSYTIPSANKSGRRSNRFTTNSLLAANRNTNYPTAVGDGYVAGSMRDYVFACRDKYYQPLYQITLTIDDVNVGTVDGPDDPNNPAINQFPNWNSTLDPQP